MRSSEAVALAYFVLFAVCALTMIGRRLGAWRTVGLSLAGAAVPLSATSTPSLSIAGVVVDLRDWWLLASLPLAYWVPAPLADRPNQRLEGWLSKVDRAIGLSRAPGWGYDPFEVAYLLVYPMVPAGLLTVLVSGPSLSADQFWRAVLVAVLPCYGLLPLLPTRPPRAIETRQTVAIPAGVRWLNAGFLATFSNAWNTLPSGHAAGAAAIAVLVWRSGSPLAPVFAALAFGIAVGTVRGRYHYVVDTVLGVALGVVAGVLA